MTPSTEASGLVLAPSVVSIETPEGIRFSLPLAGPVTRFLAWLIDMAAIAALSGFLGKLTEVVGSISRDAMVALSALASFAVSVGWGMTFEWIWRGQTPGKRVLGLQVLDANGLKLQFSQIALRNVMRFLDALPALYLAGGASMILSRRSQRLGDLVANTIVVRRPRVSAPDLARLDLDEKFNSFLEVPHLAARLRQQVSPELAQIAYEALLRRDELSAEARIEIFAEVADRCRASVKFPDEITASLTDERYVRNTLQVVTMKGSFRRRTTKTA
ncbi:MAG: RDD family protein [Acidobacteriaceae bacterium]|nr:RDD family protein [Acidobacteriaceae bacterium]